MKNTQTSVLPQSFEQMINNLDAAAYNPTIWADAVNRVSKYENCQFHLSPKNDIWQYDRFFVSYTINGINLFKTFDPFCSCLSSNGFTRLFVIDGNIFTRGFGDDGSKRVTNSKEGRKWLSENICKYGILVTTDF